MELNKYLGDVKWDEKCYMFFQKTKIRETYLQKRITIDNNYKHKHLEHQKKWLLLS